MYTRKQIEINLSSKNLFTKHVSIFSQDNWERFIDYMYNKGIGDKVMDRTLCGINFRSEEHTSETELHYGRVLLKGEDKALTVGCIVCRRGLVRWHEKTNNNKRR